MSHRSLLLLTLLLATACRSEPKSHPAPPPPDPMQALPGDAEIEAGLETVDVRTSDSELQFKLKNKSDSALDFAWSVEWYERTGTRVAGSARAWHLAKLEAGAVVECRVPMPSSDASSWRLRAVRPDSITLTQGVSR